MLCHGMTSSLTKLLENFVSEKSLYSYADGSRKMKIVSDLVQLNLEKKENLKPSSFIEEIANCEKNLKSFMKKEEFNEI